MARHFLAYDVVDDRRRRRRRWRWPFRWPWNWDWSWFRGGGTARPVRTTDYGERRRIWPWLLLLLLLLLALLAGWLWYEAANDDGGSAPAGVAGDRQTGAGAEPGDIGGGASLSVGAGASLGSPDVPSLRLRGDTTFMDLGDISCQEQRYVLMTDGKVHTMGELDDEAVATLVNSDVPVNTVALDGDANTDALQMIAQHTGGTFTKME